MDIPEQAAVGFTVGATDYERGRPGYPEGVVDLFAAELGIGPGRTVVDLAAGTGKLTRLLAARGATVVAVEPVEAMRTVLAGTVAGVEVRAGTAEAMPLDDGSVDVVTVAQAFHWFRAEDALAEIARVLRPGGGLGFVWNERDDSVPWVAALTGLIRSAGDASYTRLDGGPAALVAASGRFTPVRHRRFALAHETDADGLVDRVLSTSYLAALPAARKTAIAGDVRRMVAGFPEVFTLPYVTDAYWCHRR